MKIFPFFYYYIFENIFLKIILFYRIYLLIYNLPKFTYYFNIITMLIAAIVASFYFIENNYTGYILGEFIKNNFEKNALAVTLMFNSTFGVLTAILPTGFITMLGLTALDISYKSWVKYIWKFVLSMLVVIVLIICIMVYM